MRRCLIAYDIGDSRAREAASRRLEKEGRRLQKSVFMVEAVETAVQRLERDLRALLSQDDSLLILPACEHCMAQARIYAPAAPLCVFG